MKNPIAFSLALVLMPILGVEAQDDAQLFLGRWSLHLPGGAGWLEVEDVDGTLDASLLWYGGSVTPVASVNVTGTQLRVTRTRNVEWERPMDLSANIQSPIRWSCGVKVMALLASPTSRVPKVSARALQILRVSASQTYRRLRI